MDQRQLAFLITQLIHRVRDFPDQALREWLTTLNEIERKYDLQEKPTEEEIKAIEQGRAEIERGEYVTSEEVFERLGIGEVDTDAMGKEDFEDAICRVRRLTGEEQGDIADVIFALLNEYRYDIPPPVKD